MHNKTVCFNLNSYASCLYKLGANLPIDRGAGSGIVGCLPECTGGRVLPCGEQLAARDLRWLCRGKGLVSEPGKAAALVGGVAIGRTGQFDRRKR
eukprot:SAG25_NODE_8107_length_440_cov_0.604106_1_plen_95_part_00